MRAFTFARWNTQYKCYHICRVMAVDVAQARRAPPGDVDWTLLGDEPAHSRTFGFRTHLIRSLFAWEELANRLGLTAESAALRVHGSPIPKVQ